MSIPESFEPEMHGKTLAPPGYSLVLAEWEAEGATGERLEQAPLHRHTEDEAWYVLEGALGVRIDEVEVPSAARRSSPAAPPTPTGTRAPNPPGLFSSWAPRRTR
ncbi:hypothetical protein [Glycomyces dulcitolivorans]|uniref:hypothetical protein n=1 Tax=Glycomyces dulcitolivorans TaxID=2200759 RepID=UPI001300298B|nr:hypothetical protein [Glycomyces dulcitolivorans]